MAGVVQALHLTPGRRLLGCLEKLKGCGQLPSINAPRHPLVTPLLDLLKGEGNGTSSVQALAEAVGCVQEEDEMMVKINVDRLMLPLVQTMMSCSDYKVEDMGHRQELKFVVSKMQAGCSHGPKVNKMIKQQHYAVTLQLKQLDGREVAAVQNALDNALKYDCNQTCQQCNEENVLSLRRYIRLHCDPDFLTLVFDCPENLRKEDFFLKFSQSTYAVKVVTHWDRERKKSAVSVKRSDGWWWHGIDMDQAAQYKYNKNQTGSCNLFSKAIVLMCVRVAPFEQCEESDEDMAAQLCSQGYTDTWDNAAESEVYDSPTEYEEENYNMPEEENTNRGQTMTSTFGGSDQNLLFNLEAALTESRRTDPNLKTQAEMLVMAIRCMASFGVVCLLPDPHDYTPLDGDCLWTCFVKARKPSLVGADLRAEVFHCRLRCVSAAIEEIKDMDEERLAMVQSVIANANRGVPPQSREEIIDHLSRYMESGTWNGLMGDILPYVAAAFLNQGLLIINLDVNTISYAAPECKMFHGKEEFKVPCIAARQVNHFEAVPVKPDSCNAATGLYELLRNGEHLTLPAEVGIINNSGAFDTVQTSSSLTRGGRQAPTMSQPNSVQRLYHCNCGYKGVIAIHLRASSQCLQTLRQELSITEEISDELLIIHAALIFGGCPATGCSGGDHAEIPHLCLSWWREIGSNLMQWQGITAEVNSAFIWEKTKEFVRDSTSGFGQQDGGEGSNQADNVSILYFLSYNNMLTISYTGEPVPADQWVYSFSDGIAEVW